MKKKIANILTTARIVISTILLFFFNEISTIFIILFSIGVFTDLIDGTIARKTGSVSIVGSVLDTIADTLLAINIFKIVFLKKMLSSVLIVWLVINLALALITAIVTATKFKRIFFVHSIMAKILGGVVYLLPFGIYFNIYNVHMIIALTLFSVTMIENLLIVITLNEPNSDARSLLSVLKERHSLNQSNLKTDADNTTIIT